MKPGARALAYAIPALVAAWVGVRLHAIHSTGAGPGIPVPAGLASAPGAEELAVPAPGRLPERLPAFTLNDLEGKPRPISAWQGRSLIVNFWATWCDPCRREIPLLESLNTAWAARKFTVIGIAVDHPDKVAAFAREYAIGYPLLVGEQDALDLAGRLGMQTPVFPFTLFSDNRGRIVALFVGELHKPQADLILGVVSDVNADRLALDAARQAIADGLSALATRS